MLNRNSASSSSGGNIIVAAVGDSNTYGYGVMFNRRRENSYPAQLQAMLGDEYEIMNYGVSGSTLLSTGDRPYMSSPMYAKSLRAHPDIVLLMLGTNDAKRMNWDARRYERELEQFAYSYRSLANRPNIYLLTVPFVRVDNGHPKPSKVDGIIARDEVVPIIKNVAKKIHVPCIDIYSATKDHPELFSDGVHPNVEGYGLIARAVYDAICHDAR